MFIKLKQNKEIQKDQNLYKLKPRMKKGTTKVHWFTYFRTSVNWQNLGIIFEWILYHSLDFYPLITSTLMLLSLIIIQHALITSSLYWFLQFTTVTFFVFTNNFLLYYAIKTVELMTCEVVSFEKVSLKCFMKA